MPIKECEKDGKPGYQWGSGACYTYTPGNEESKKEARRKAEDQAAAAYANGYGKSEHGGMLISKTFEAKHTQETPTNADLEAIRQYALRDVTSDEVFTGKMALANDQIDRSFERFPLTYLQRMAETLPGKPVLTGHRDDLTPVGKFYSADVVPRPNGSGNDLIARYYMRSDHELVKEIELGIASGVSIRARADKRTCGLCAKDWDGPSKDRCSHQVGRDYDGRTCHLEWGGDPSKVESIEGSFVSMPCQRDAQALARSLPSGYLAKSTAPGGAQILDYGAADPAPQGDEMEIKEALEKIATLEGELATLTTWKTENEPLVKAGEQYRLRLLKEIHSKTAAVYDDEAADAMVKTLEKGSVESLLTWDESTQKRFDEKFPPAPNGQVKKDEAPPAPRPFDPVATNPYQRRMF